MEIGNQAPTEYSIFPMFWLLMWCELQLSSPWCLGFPAMMKFVLRTQISSLWLQLFSSEYYISNRKLNNRKRRHTQNLEAHRGRKGWQCFSEQELHFWMGTAPSVMILKGKAKGRDISFIFLSFPSVMVSHIHASGCMKILGKQRSREGDRQLILVQSN